ncbi:DMT family transporter [Sedimentitalea sp. JM2-8]|uniref:DMT family transporter n=1 Tax=Sedimentitalea xiamensis TaxID=3050037 RepID=A0ABT7FJB6_9RHOB|nr:DMT family transporter [Sedimentitalea xiamensis]MDK3075227.1 DMT family transporter [Sedimentitalea xiamensis]
MRFRTFSKRLLADWMAQTPVLRCSIFMCVSTLAFAVMQVSVRAVSAELPPFQIAFFRNLFGLAFLVPLLVGQGWAQMRTQRLGLHALRGLVNIGAMLMFFTAVATTPLAKVTALSFTAPVFAAALSVLVLGETFRLHRWTAILFGFLGMLIILRPGLAIIEPGAFLVLGSAVLWAVAMIIIKILSRTESSVAIVAWMGVSLCLFSIGPALMVWQTPSPTAWLWLAFIGFTGSVAQVSLSQALKETDPTAVLPFDFLKLIWTALLAAWLFGEIPDIHTWIGAGVIFGSGLYIARRERRAAAQAKA